MIMSEKQLNNYQRMSMSESIRKSLSRNNTWSKRSSLLMSGLLVDDVFRTWAEISKTNFVPHFILSDTSVSDNLTARQSGLLERASVWPSYLKFITDEDILHEVFFVNVTPLLNDMQLWGCFYNFPDLYDDCYSPVERIREVKDVAKLVGGVLTRDMVTACLTYLKRTPILEDFVLIKLDLSSKHLVNIKVLQHYKYIVYLDLSSNYLTELSVLSYLPYLQYLTVAYNRLTTVLEYETPQWFLTEVHYKYNNVKKIRDISMFWSITVLDLSHNNITAITGLENLKFLRRLDLSFNHIQRIENLDNMLLLWLDLSYNNISTFEFGSSTGLWTLLHLEYLNLNENSLTSMKVFAGCVRLREIHARNNRLQKLLELAVFMRQLSQLTILDLRENPVCSAPCYKDVVINTFPLLLQLDDEDLDPEYQTTVKMKFYPDVFRLASKKLLRLLYIQQLGRATVSQFEPPADTQDIPLVVLVGYEAVGKGFLARRLALELEKHVEYGRQHTTSSYYYTGHFKEVTRDTFDDMLINGEFLTYSEFEGESYGLSREEACVKDGKVKIVTLDLISALMLKQRGLRPYLILANFTDTEELLERQHERKQQRKLSREKDISKHINVLDKSALQVILSERIIIRGILNDVLQDLPLKETSSDMNESNKWISDIKKTMDGYTDASNVIVIGSTSEVESDMPFDIEASLHSIYKQSDTTDDYENSGGRQNSYSGSKKSDDRSRPARTEEKGGMDFSRYVSTTWKGIQSTTERASKSVTFESYDDGSAPPERKSNVLPDAARVTTKSGLLIEAPTKWEDTNARSISTKVPFNRMSKMGQNQNVADNDLWISFLDETGLLRISDLNAFSPSDDTKYHAKSEDQGFILEQLEMYDKIPNSPNLRCDYEEIHHDHPGLFYDTVKMDEPDAAFEKMKKIIKNIVKMQKLLSPMFDIDFTNFENYPAFEERLNNICKELSPTQLFF